jgi:hypothetical protein
MARRFAAPDSAAHVTARAYPDAAAHVTCAVISKRPSPPSACARGAVTSRGQRPRRAARGADGRALGAAAGRQLLVGRRGGGRQRGRLAPAQDRGGRRGPARGRREQTWPSRLPSQAPAAADRRAGGRAAQKAQKCGACDALPDGRRQVRELRVDPTGKVGASRHRRHWRGADGRFGAPKRIGAGCRGFSHVLARARAAAGRERQPRARDARRHRGLLRPPNVEGNPAPSPAVCAP